MMGTLASLAQTLSGTLQGADTSFSRVVTDTRQLAAGDLFVALKGERFDAHEFIGEARQRGAAGALVARVVDDALPQVRVADTLDGLQQFAMHWRARFTNPVVAVTGSNGKTTTKQMLSSIFAARGPVLATAGNLNNHIGVPLTLLSLRAEHQTAVIEMGANHLREIARLTELARPGVGVVTQAGDAHLEGFGSRDGVARGKGELFAGLREGIAVINHDDVYFPLWKDMAAGGANSVLSFGLTERADVHALHIEVGAEQARFDLVTPGGRAAVRLPLAGRHNVANALAAAACGVALGLEPDEIARGLGAVRNVGGRLAWKATPQGARLVDDSYNANPTSLRAAMELLAAQPGHRVLVLGGMAELGADAAERHAEAGRIARALGIDVLLTLGPLAAEAASAFGEGGENFSDHAALAERAQALLARDTTVLVKGSRSARMERVVAALTGDKERVGDGGEH
jgi:UDP-N-acetylmuramoyl-tripeptide--D-alanyl-D-alanine ligase